MNRTRLQVPLTPPEPHFDDESTIVSARRVVPIGRARFSRRWRNVRALAALLLLATVCGALGAAVVNHFEKRQGFSATPIGPALKTDEFQKPSTSSSPQVLITSDSRTGGATIPQEQSPESEAPTNTPSVASASLENETSKSSTNDNFKSDVIVEPGHLTRKRRVHEINRGGNRLVNGTSELKTRGAGRIQDIFNGSNP